MKTYFSLKMGLIIGLVSVLMFTSCQNDEISEASLLEEEPELTADAEESDPTLRINTSVLFPTTARLFGKCNEDWAVHLAKGLATLNCENVNDAQLLKLTDKVVAPLFDLEDATFEYTITKDQFVLLPATLVFIYYGCPEEYGWEPAEGQSVEDWMNEIAVSIIDGVEKFDIYFDGIKIEDIENYRLNTGVFSFTANPDLAECYEPCYTGMPQPGLVDGYFLMFKKMKKGKHTILVRGALPAFDLDYDITINLNVIN